jgi:hypothetical protein
VVRARSHGHPVAMDHGGVHLWQRAALAAGATLSVQAQGAGSKKRLLQRGWACSSVCTCATKLGSQSRGVLAAAGCGLT